MRANRKRAACCRELRGGNEAVTRLRSDSRMRLGKGTRSHGPSTDIEPR